MTVHLLVHLLDDVRHEFPSTLSWEAIKTNLGASVWQVGIAVAVWPKLRKFLAKEFHAESQKAHAELEKLKKEAHL